MKLTLSFVILNIIFATIFSQTITNQFSTDPIKLKTELDEGKITKENLFNAAMNDEVDFKTVFQLDYLFEVFTIDEIMKIEKKYFDASRNSDGIESNNNKIEKSLNAVQKNYDLKFTESNIYGTTEFGISVATAGDFNGDGYDDILVGAWGSQNYKGAVYIFLGGVSMDSKPDLVLFGENEGDYFGQSVSSAGDVNNDGYDDIIIGAYGYNSRQGRAYIYFGSSDLSNTTPLIFTGEATGNNFGYSVSSAGNVNGDDYDDVIIGAYGFNVSRGKAYIYFGDASMDATADFTVTGIGISNNLGRSVACAGLVNADAYSDIIIGANGVNTNKGAAYLFYGSLTIGGNVTSANAALTFSGESSNNHFGRSVSSAGDFNNNGYDDIIIGAWGYSSSRGRAYIYYGGPAIDNIADITMTGEASNNYFGASVSKAGNINNDVYDDVIVGAFGYNTSTGRAYIYNGNNSNDGIADLTINGLSINSYLGYSVGYAGNIDNDSYDDFIVGSYRYNNYAGRADIFTGSSSPDNIVDVEILGPGTDNKYGSFIAGIGDINKDGFDDFLVSAPNYKNKTGRVYLYFGNNTSDKIVDFIFTGENEGDNFGCCLSSAGDFNNDTYRDILIGADGFNNGLGKAYLFSGATLSNIPLLEFNANTNDTAFGCSVAVLGDVNNDGKNDIIIGASRYGEKVGRAYVYFGGTPLNNVPDLVLTGEDVDNYFGTCVSSAGDFNGDSYKDILVGAIGHNSYTGKAYIYFGGPGIDNVSDITFTGEFVGNLFGTSLATVGDLNGDGYDDVIISATGYNNNTGRAYIYFGNNISDNSADVVLTGKNIGNRFGLSVSSAGFVNSDIYPDVVVGAPGYNSNTGRDYIFYGGQNMNDIENVILTGEGVNNYFGQSVSSVGDFDGTGKAGIVVGAYNNGDNGAAYLYMLDIQQITLQLKVYLQGAYR